MKMSDRKTLYCTWRKVFRARKLYIRASLMRANAFSIRRFYVRKSSDTIQHNTTQYNTTQHYRNVLVKTKVENDDHFKIQRFAQISYTKRDIFALCVQGVPE